MAEERQARRDAIDRVRRSARWRENKLRIQDIQILLEGSSASSPSSSDDEEIDPLQFVTVVMDTSGESDTEERLARLRRARLLRQDVRPPPSRRTPPRVVTPPPRVATPPPVPVRVATPPPTPRVATPPPSPPRVVTPPPRVATPPVPVRVATPPPLPRVATPPPSPPFTRSRARLQSAQGEIRRSARLRAINLNRMDAEFARRIVLSSEREKTIIRHGGATRTRSGRLSYRPYCIACGCCK